MSTKTIAIETSVYQRLEMEKIEAESFTKVIDRLLVTAGQLHTGKHLMQALKTVPCLDLADAERMHAVVGENRKHGSRRADPRRSR